MKKLLYLLLIVGTCFSANAQKKSGEKVEEAIENGLEKLGGLFGRKKKKKTPPTKETTPEKKGDTVNPFGGLNKMLGGGKKVDLPDTYEFGSNMKVEVSVVENGKKSEGYSSHSTYYFPKDASKNFVGIRTELKEEENKQISSAFMVADDGKIISFIDQENLKMATVMNLDKVAEDSEEEDDGKYEAKAEEAVNNLKKTGNTKTILGYTCHEYVTETNETKVTFWLAPALADQSQSMASMYLAFSKAKQVGQNPFFGADQKGMMLEMTSVDKNTGDASSFKTVELNLNKPFSFPAKDYPQMNFGDMMKNANY